MLTLLKLPTFETQMFTDPLQAIQGISPRANPINPFTETQHSDWLTARSTATVVQLIVSQIIQTFAAFYRTSIFTNVLSTTCHWSLL